MTLQAGEKFTRIYRARHVRPASIIDSSSRLHLNSAPHTRCLSAALDRKLHESVRSTIGVSGGMLQSTEQWILFYRRMDRPEAMQTADLLDRPEGIPFVYRSIDAAGTDRRGGGASGIPISRRDPWRLESMVSDPPRATTRCLNIVGPMSSRMSRGRS